MTDQTENTLADRKLAHIELTRAAQMDHSQIDHRFDYEPLFASHPLKGESPKSIHFLGKTLKAPIWISSMTGGVGAARHINQNLARAACEFGLGMGLGSCRPLLESDEFFEDFALRPIIGSEQPFYANLGIAQIEQLLAKNEKQKILDLVERLDADGLIIHLNPLQEWLQPEGDRLMRPAFETIQELLEGHSLPIIVKEVGQGMGPRSLEALIRLPLAAIDFAAFGGTNFAKLEVLRGDPNRGEQFLEMTRVGHTPEQMVHEVNRITNELGEKALCREFIISGGLKSFLQGHHLISTCTQKAIYGQARLFLEHAKGSYEELQQFVSGQLEGLAMASRFLKVKE